MKTKSKLVALVAIMLSSAAMSTQSIAKTFTSGEEKVQLVELYSSQGCSSCPPAQNYLNKFSRSPELWNTVVPVVFHVDYWDYLGWKDPYSSASYTQRQRQFKKAGRSASVYTPEFIVGGEEWRGFFRRQDIPDTSEASPELSVTIENGKLSASFKDKNLAQDETLALNIAFLGMDLTTQVQAGENRARSLKENFIVLEHSSIESNNGSWSASITPPDSEDKIALAAWVTKKDDLEPLQATGGPINF